MLFKVVRTDIAVGRSFSTLAMVFAVEYASCEACNILYDNEQLASFAERRDFS